MKRDCLIIFLSVCVIAVSTPNSFCKSPAVIQEPSQSKTAEAKSEAAAGKKESQTDTKTHSRSKPRNQQRAEEMKWKIRNLGIASRVTIKLNNSNERYGSIERIDEDSFQLAEVDLKQIFTINYSDVKMVREGYGNPNQFTGKRWNPIWAKISVAAVIVMFAVIIPLSIPRT